MKKEKYFITYHLNGCTYGITQQREIRCYFRDFFGVDKYSMCLLFTHTPSDYTVKIQRMSDDKVWIV